MKALTILFFVLIGFGASAQRRRNYRTSSIPTYQYAKPTATYPQAHPYYGGEHHTESHGGYYQGGQGSSHKGGHYVNPKTYNTYGRHKSK